MSRFVNKLLSAGWKATRRSSSNGNKAAAGKREETFAKLIIQTHTNTQWGEKKGEVCGD